MNILDTPSGVWQAYKVPWPKPEYTRSRVTAAGKIISGRKEPHDALDLDAALSVAANWRSAHGYPLHVVKSLLNGRARTVDKNALVVGRQKRLPSIIKKLQRFHAMQLSTMQDLGGCRAVVRTVSRVDTLVKMYKDNPTSSARFIGGKDYILDPKPDGYRSVHLVYEYQGRSQNDAFCGLQIEVQIRSRLQHAWATALETIDTFTDEALKSGLGNDLWKRFFVLVSGAIAFRERRPRVPDTPTTWGQLTKELIPLCQRLKVPDVFYGLPLGLHLTAARQQKGITAYVLELDFDARRVSTTGFDNNEDAANEYLTLEKDSLNRPNIQVVLVTADSLSALRNGYPSYYLDTKRFTDLIGDLLKHESSDAAKVTIG